MSAATPQKPAGRPEKKPRNPIERTIVWSAILILLGVLVFEGAARFGYGRTFSNIKQGVEEGESRDAGLTLTEAEGLISGWPQRTSQAQGKMQLVRYRWPSLVKTYEISLPVTEEGVVLAWSTADPAEEPEEPAATADEAGAETADASPHGATPSAAGGGDRPRRGGNRGGPAGRGKKGTPEASEPATDTEPATEAEPPTNTEPPKEPGAPPEAEPATENGAAGEP